jgi:hypothetical protein
MEKYEAGILAVAIICSAVIFASASILSDTIYFSQMLIIVGGGAASRLIMLARAGPKNG